MQDASLIGSFCLFVYVYSDVSFAYSFTVRVGYVLQNSHHKQDPKAFANGSVLNYKGSEERS